ncbi:MAG: ferrous iron transport protein B [Candidatus Lokiarchaeota archaeon]|nr:ferrous iron transport protein B [Candidatus Lokiarchaeota archaeon]MBD3341148.1 ferrous iron transport protein B [Candidatus Lokiarchaeota archaeon]
MNKKEFREELKKKQKDLRTKRHFWRKKIKEQRINNRKHFKNRSHLRGSRKNKINIALAGNPNVGKSVIFNQLTGLSQTIGNWPGKTVEKMEGSLEFLGYHFNIVDLPGIYSLSTFSLEEIVSREYIVSEEVDIIINVVDATNLERNLFLTFQLLELKVPMIIAINQMDILHKRNIDLDFDKLEKIFKFPVLPLVAVHGIGVHELLEEAIEMVIFRQAHRHYDGSEPEECDHHFHDYYRIEHIRKRRKRSTCLKEEFKFPNLSNILSFGKEVEEKVQKLTADIKKCEDYFAKFKYPSRFLAVKVLEKDEEIEKLFDAKETTCKILERSDKYREELEDYHGEDINTIISSEIYNNINKIVSEVVLIEDEKKSRKKTIADTLDHLTTHSVWGYVILVLVVIGIYAFTFSVGDFFGALFEMLYDDLTVMVYNEYGEETFWVKLLWDGGVGGFFGAVGGVLVYVIPFFLIIEILQDSGYLPRAAFLMDRVMHIIGVHGKTIIPMILGFGCNVPACAGCRIMETKREKKISIALTSLVPCAAVMTVVLGLVGRYLGLGWVFVLFLINLSVILLVGRILNKTMPGSCTELIMEMHEYRVPNYSVIMKQTWLRSKEFIFKALPIIIILGVFLEILLIFNALEPINLVISPITVFWLGLPVITGVFLIYGILRKELTLVLLALLASSIGIAITDLLTPIQMIVFCLVTMLYIPCFATIIIIAKNTSWKYALQISLMEIALALLIGGAIHFGYIFLFSSL